ncbi:swi five-dependent recombination repair protein Sfr1 [Schizosaccharomyces cryophilus OY26]|uniref:Swi five-dependent recombination repair protein Sfr1 n=1 Tax=Schizosaccharomyces cryophilus (strain OY26 / ATCC MYA-4695 / CBS 11777 / NBRC 106824 / NRRL Y48691) TaxID=653667 RepID=S9WWQ3_SCHCR|nr:swi five-dependent recombination repair protein Sfr1 [Schizosaccharomyces cryophilus OY26]EPY49172.1 swi five-dependent recombination repair protein Sfr1 [Schizosaccharomyces cryophilus OY26]
MENSEKNLELESEADSYLSRPAIDDINSIHSEEAQISKTELPPTPSRDNSELKPTTPNASQDSSDLPSLSNIEKHTTNTQLNPPNPRKRAREAKSVLLKPFKSPLKYPATPKTTPGTCKVANYASDELKSSDDVLSDPISSPSRPSPRVIKRAKKVFRSPISATNKVQNDPEVARLLSERLKLEKDVRNLQEQLTTAEAAVKVELKNEDKDLEGLVFKWRGVAQRAAQVLYRPMAERIRLAGGVTQTYTIQEGENKGNIEETRSEFSMGMFLQQFGVPFDLIAYDEEFEDWKG